MADQLPSEDFLANRHWRFSPASRRRAPALQIATGNLHLTTWRHSIINTFKITRFSYIEKLANTIR